MSEMPARLLAMSSYGAGAASTRVRIGDWLRHFGIDAEVHGWAGLPNARVGTLARHPAAVIAAERRVRGMDTSGRTLLVSREVSPLSGGGIEARLMKRASRAVYDFDDAVYLGSGLRGAVIDMEAKTRRCVTAADLVIAGSETLAEWASGHGTEVILIPSCVDPSDYDVKSNYECADPPTLVWVGSPATEQYVADIADELALLHERYGLRLRLVSGPGDNPDLGHISHMVDRVPWSLESQRSALATADIAIAPLTDTAFARGKCAYKLLQYASSALPIVGSPVGANALALARFEGVSARPGEWAEALTAVLDEGAERRAARGRAARTGVEQHYSFAAWAPTWLATVSP